MVLDVLSTGCKLGRLLMRHPRPRGCWAFARVHHGAVISMDRFREVSSTYRFHIVLAAPRSPLWPFIAAAIFAVQVRPFVAL
jgi:hypothetical protein